MKKILLSALVLIELTSCNDNWDGKVRGRRYKIQLTCIESHIEISTMMQPMGKSFLYMPQSIEVCDKYKVDTIWEKTFKQQEL